MSDERWVVGDTFGMPIPADAVALLGGGIDYLTTAFQRFGVLAGDNHVTAITEAQECAGGSTGRKLFLALRYAYAQEGLPTQLFVKFSRDFDNPRRDRGRTQMDLEVRFAILARGDFPITVPLTVFADYHRASGTGILITERIPFGQVPVEPHYAKCLDYLMPEQPEHYRALLSTVARLGGAHRAGRLPTAFSHEFAYDTGRVGVGTRVQAPREQLREKVIRYGSFAASHPDLVPEPLRSLTFIRRMADEVGLIADAEDAVMAELTGSSAHVALCHWNANVDNAWFWRDGDGRLTCGLLDWGCVSEMNIAMPLWGALCSAEPEVWDDHFDSLLAHFAAEFTAAGGPALDTTLLRRQLISYAVVMGVAWLLDAPATISAVVPGLSGVTDRRDAPIADNEVARSQLLMLTNFLNLWQRNDVGAIIAVASRH